MEVQFGNFKHASVPSLKTCTKCNTDLPMGEFGNNKRSSDGLRHWCKPCYSTYAKAYRRGEDTGTKKYQPKKLDLVNQAIEVNPRSDEQLAYQNWVKAEKRKKTGKPTCAFSGCITKILYVQEEYCLKHEQVMRERDVDIKLAKRC